MKAYAVILGGGSGTRMGGDRNKVFLPIRGIPAIVRAAVPFTGLCAGAVFVAQADEITAMEAIVKQFGLSRFAVAVVAGGSTRQDSVWNGLCALPDDADIVLIHDGARALVTVDVVTRALQSAQERGSGIASLSVSDTVKRVGPDGDILETLDRQALRAMQTPQAFRVELIRQAHRLARRDGFQCTDDAALLEHAGMEAYVTEGSVRNIKLTTSFDILLALALLEEEEQ